VGKVRRVVFCAYLEPKKARKGLFPGVGGPCIVVLTTSSFLELLEIRYIEKAHPIKVDVEVTVWVMVTIDCEWEIDLRTVHFSPEERELLNQQLPF